MITEMQIGKVGPFFSFAVFRWMWKCKTVKLLLHEDRSFLNIMNLSTEHPLVKMSSAIVTNWTDHVEMSLLQFQTAFEYHFVFISIFYIYHSIWKQWNTLCFRGCWHRTNVYGSFRTRRSRNDKDCSVNDFKPETLEKQWASSSLSVENHYSDHVHIDSVGAEPSDILSTEDLGDARHIVSLLITRPSYE